MTMAPCFDAVDGGDVGVVERGQDLGFAVKRAMRSGSSAKERGQDLNGDVAVEFGIGRAIDGAHAAFAELGSDFVVRDLGRHGHSLSTPIVSLSGAIQGVRQKLNELGLDDAPLLQSAARGSGRYCALTLASRAKTPGAPSLRFGDHPETIALNSCKNFQPLAKFKALGATLMQNR